MNGSFEHFSQVLADIRAEVGKVIIGQAGVLDQSLITILTGQHALLEGVPGVAKTLLVRTLARVLDCPFDRIQFTPDLMPADITGTNVFNLQQNSFTLVPGPVFTTFLLADEINRAPAKTQSALLQVMQERTVTIDRTTHVLSPCFTVFATQNPVEYEGTFPLPEAQKDRFMLKIPMGYPDREQELDLTGRMLGDAPPEETLRQGAVRAVIGMDGLAGLKKCLQQVVVREELTGYVVDIIRQTRAHDSVLLGAGPRASQALILSSRARAALDGRNFVTPDDVKIMARPVLEHRLVLRPEMEIEGLTVAEVIERILQEVAVPR